MTPRRYSATEWRGESCSIWRQRASAWGSCPAWWWAVAFWSRRSTEEGPEVAGCLENDCLAWLRKAFLRLLFMRSYPRIHLPNSACAQGQPSAAMEGCGRASHDTHPCARAHMSGAPGGQWMIPRSSYPSLRRPGEQGATGTPDALRTTNKKSNRRSFDCVRRGTPNCAQRRQQKRRCPGLKPVFLLRLFSGRKPTAPSE